MGQYINHDSNGNQLPGTGKAEALIQDGATKITTPNSFKGNLVCVVENVTSDTAAYIYSKSKFKYFRNFQKDGSYYNRSFTWLLCTNEQIAQAR